MGPKSRRFSLLVLIVAVPAIALAGLQLSIGEHGFDWTTVEDDRAHFRWTADVTNDGGGAVEADVTVELLDDDDGVIHRDSTTATLQAGETRTVTHEGDLAFDQAADVVSFRFRIEPRTR